MSTFRELTGRELNHSYQPSDFQFHSLEDIKGTNDFFGQEEAMDAIAQGLKIEDNGYNLYVCSEHCPRLDKMISRMVQKAALTKKPALAMGYLYNFQHPSEPILIEIPTDIALGLRDDLEEFSAVIINDLPILLDSDEVKREQKKVIEEFEELKAEKLYQLSEKAKEKNLQLKMTEESVKFIPLDDEGKAMSYKMYEALGEEEQVILNESIEWMQLVTDQVMENIEQQEEYYYELYEEIKQEAVLKTLGGMIRKLQEKYAPYDKIQCYLNGLAEDLLKNVELLAISESEGKEAKKEMAPWILGSVKEKLTQDYGFNLLTTPTDKGAPVICDEDYLSMELAGRALVDTDASGVNMHFMNIRPGLMQLANHGYLILHMQNILEKNNAWRQLKYTLRTGKLRIEKHEEAEMSLLGCLAPEEATAHLKVILIGSETLYELLCNYDETFKHYFKVKVDLNDEVDTSQQEIEKLAKAIKKIAKQEKLPNVTIDGLLAMVAYSNRKLGSPEKFEGDIEVYLDLLREAKVFNKKIADATCIKRVIKARERRECQLKKHLEDTIIDKTYLIDTAGEKIGQINGIAVVSLGELSCGRPIRITATTYRGKAGVVDIDATAKLSGAIHTKGVHIITGFLGHQFAQDFPLALHCNLCIEQNYTAIDGDSASSAELYAIISSLAEIPIKQYLAVTGSMNQFGGIQPIGGVNEKIEGFFKICERRGLQGSEGVIIPKQNSKDLILDEEIIEAVEKGKFHIYEVESVWDAMELLMGTGRQEIAKKAYEKLKKFSS